MNHDDSFARAADAIAHADALLIGAGAGMGVDSGLPDFRGSEGFWRAYPPFRGRPFAQMSTPHWFQTDPALAWGFFGHRLGLYRNALPHAGFAMLRKWGAERPLGFFVFTSNVDGQFQRAGFPDDRILERHGSIHFLQCAACCTEKIWPVGDLTVDVDPDSFRAQSRPPTCPDCGGIARPNILMFNDDRWLDGRSGEQYARYLRWLAEVEEKNVVAIELGAGLGVPTVRRECEASAGALIRINPQESETPAGGISLACGALHALERIDRCLDARS